MISKLTDVGRGPLPPVAEKPDLLEKLVKINTVLMDRVERSLDEQTGAFALFQTAVALEKEVQSRTAELKAALERLEYSNRELMIAREVAERSNRSKSGFLTSASHDLLQPLHAARLNLSTLADVDDREERDHLLSHVDHALSTIEEMLVNMLEIAKLEAGIKPSIKSLSLQELFSALSLDLLPLARAKSLPLHFRETNLWIRSDPLMMRRMIQNLVANAIRYTAEGGVRVFAKANGGSIEVAVLDTGPGIEASERAQIFEEFERGSASERTDAMGLGLGLSIVRRMAEALGHPVRLWSHPGLGSCFKIEAPAAQPLASANADTRLANIIPPCGLASAKVVVIENDRAIAKAMHKLLVRWGCDIRVTLSIEEAEQLCREGNFRPDLILADYHLSSQDCGLTAIECFRSAYGMDLPAVVVTADRTERTAWLIQTAGCELVRKPVKPAELRALIAHILS